MKSQPERQLEQKCRRYARQHGFIMMKLEKNGHKGVPDDIILMPSGRFFLIEFKNGSLGHVRAEQQVFLERFKNCAFVVRDFETFKELLNNQ